MSGVCLEYPAADGDVVGTSVSVLEKLIHTHPIWLLLSIDQQEATNILLKQPAGVKEKGLFSKSLQEMKYTHKINKCFSVEQKHNHHTNANINTIIIKKIKK